MGFSFPPNLIDLERVWEVIASFYSDLRKGFEKSSSDD